MVRVISQVKLPITKPIMSVQKRNAFGASNRNVNAKNAQNFNKTIDDIGTAALTGCILSRFLGVTGKNDFTIQKVATFLSSDRTWFIAFTDSVGKLKNKERILFDLLEIVANDKDAEEEFYSHTHRSAYSKKYAIMRGPYEGEAPTVGEIGCDLMMVELKKRYLDLISEIDRNFPEADQKTQKTNELCKHLQVTISFIEKNLAYVSTFSRSAYPNLKSLAIKNHATIESKPIPMDEPARAPKANDGKSFAALFQKSEKVVVQETKQVAADPVMRVEVLEDFAKSPKSVLMRKTLLDSIKEPSTQKPEEFVTLDVLASDMCFDPIIMRKKLFNTIKPANKQKPCEIVVVDVYNCDMIPRKVFMRKSTFDLIRDVADQEPKQLVWVEIFNKNMVIERVIMPRGSYDALILH